MIEIESLAGARWWWRRKPSAAKRGVGERGPRHRLVRFPCPGGREVPAQTAKWSLEVAVGLDAAGDLLALAERRIRRLDPEQRRERGQRVERSARWPRLADLRACTIRAEMSSSVAMRTSIDDGGLRGRFAYTLGQ